jgi:carboxypeptidase T
MLRISTGRLSAALVATFLGILMASGAKATVILPADQPLWMKVTAKDKFDRTKVVSTGVSIEVTADDYVMVLGDATQAAALAKMGVLIAKFPATKDLLDFPTRDSNFHNYAELKAELDKLVAAHPQIAALDSIGKSVEGRELFRLHISKDLAHASQLPATLIMGGHHAREHVSVEIPLMFAQRLLANYDAGDKDAVRLIGSRDIQIVPLVNPDGAEYDIQNGSYKLWRKNRAQNNDGTYGVDLNRNYSKGWDPSGNGASTDTTDETYHGPVAFSEPETQAVKKWVDSNPNATTLLTLHTYSELILYPWGGDYSSVPDRRDASVFETMANQMAEWNGYKPMQASGLYIATGDTCDWAYATHKIFAFTFEMDPSGFVSDGFYPGEAKLPEIFEKNFKPMMYMIDVADNPYKVIEPKQAAWGLTTPLIQ